MPKVDTVTEGVSQVGRQQLISEVACKFIRTNHGHWKSPNSEFTALSQKARDTILFKATRNVSRRAYY